MEMSFPHKFQQVDHRFSAVPKETMNMQIRFLYAVFYQCGCTYQVLHLFLKSHQRFSSSNSKHICVHIFIIHCHFYLL